MLYFHYIYTEKHQLLDNDPTVICHDTGGKKQVKEHKAAISGTLTAHHPDGSH